MTLINFNHSDIFIRTSQKDGVREVEAIKTSLLAKLYRNGTAVKN